MFVKLCMVLLIAAVFIDTTYAGRVKRFTCSFTGDRGCEIHCYILNRQGGWCDSQNVCHCRQERIFNGRNRRNAI